MNRFSSELGKNGEIIDFKDCGNNNYMFALNIGNQRNKIPDYLHCRTTEEGMVILNTHLGNYLNQTDLNVVIMRDAKKGFYLYDLEKGIIYSKYFDKLEFIKDDNQTLIYATDIIRNSMGDIFIQLCSCLKEDSSFNTPIYNKNKNHYYDNIDNYEDYLKLKQEIREEINKTITDDEVIKKLTKKKEERK